MSAHRTGPDGPTTAGLRRLAVRRLGTVPYAQGLELQAELVAARRAGTIPDTLLLLEHPHVITLGSSADADDVLVGADERERAGIELYEVGRGGGVTYHGPGQLVGYPILDLKPDRKDLHAYLRDLEEVLIRVAATFGVTAVRRPGLTGVWTASGKLAAIGVRVASQWITSHGVAINVASDLSFFDRIVPCGIHGESVTSLERELGRTVDIDEVGAILVQRFADVFGCEIRGSVDNSVRPVSRAVRSGPGTPISQVPNGASLVARERMFRTPDVCKQLNTVLDAGSSWATKTNGYNELRRHVQVAAAHAAQVLQGSDRAVYHPFAIQMRLIEIDGVGHPSLNLKRELPGATA